MVVFASFTSWTLWTEGSIVETDGLFTVGKVHVISRQFVPRLVKSVVTINNILIEFPLVTVTSFTVIVVVVESVVAAESVSLNTNGDFANSLWIIDWVTATFFWLFTAARVNKVGVLFQTTFVFLFAVNVKVPVVVVGFQSFALQFLKFFVVRVIWTFVTNAFVRVATFVQNFFDLFGVTVRTVWVKFTRDVFFPMFGVTWFFVVTIEIDTYVFWTADVESSSQVAVATVVTPGFGGSEVLIFSADWKSWAVVSFIITSPRVTFSADARNAVTFRVDFSDLEGDSVFPVTVTEIFGTDIIVWNTFFQDFAAITGVHAVNSGEIFITFTWLVTLLWVAFAFSSVAKTFRFFRVWSVSSGDEVLSWSTFWSINRFTLTTFLDFANVVFSAAFDAATATPDSSSTTV